MRDLWGGLEWDIEGYGGIREEGCLERICWLFWKLDWTPSLNQHLAYFESCQRQSSLASLNPNIMHIWDIFNFPNPRFLPWCSSEALRSKPISLHSLLWTALARLPTKTYLRTIFSSQGRGLVPPAWKRRNSRERLSWLGWRVKESVRGIPSCWWRNSMSFGSKRL